LVCSLLVSREMASSPSNPSTPTSRPASSPPSPLTTISHPLDPADSFIHIDSPSPSNSATKLTSVPRPKKDVSSSNLEDGWDFVESADDRPVDVNPLSLSSHVTSSKAKPSTATTSSSTATPSSKPVRSSSSMPPSTTASSQKTFSNMQVVDPIQPKHHHHPKPLATSRSSAELTGHSGFKHRIYCSLYNLYHAQPSEAPSLSNSPIYMMGAILTSSSDGDSKYNADSYSSTPPSSTSPPHLRKDVKPKSASDTAKNFKEEFLEMCRSLIFFSYRKDFAKIEGFGVTSDVGWGCMLRTGQMLLATALQRLHEPLISAATDSLWRTSSDSTHMRVPVGHEVMNAANTPLITQLVLDWFRDSPDMDRHPYSIHNLVRTSLVLNPPLDGSSTSGPSWFSPTKLARILRFVVRVHSPENMTMYVPPEGVVYVDEVVALCTERHTSSMSPASKNAHQDRTYLWWKRYSANGPSISSSRSITIPDYDESEQGSDSETEINQDDIENDALYPRALAESIAQYESESSRSTSSSSNPAAVAGTSAAAYSLPTTPHLTHHDSLSSRQHQQQYHQLLSPTPSGSTDSDLLSWTVREWNEPTRSSSSLGPQHPHHHPPPLQAHLHHPHQQLPKNGIASPANEAAFASLDSHLLNLSTHASDDASSSASTSKSAPSQQYHHYGYGPLAKSSDSVLPRASSDSSSSGLDASSSWVQLDMSSRGNSLEAAKGRVTSPRGNGMSGFGSEDSSSAMDDGYFSSPPHITYEGPLNLSALVETHEYLQGEPKAHVSIQHHHATSPTTSTSTGAVLEGGIRSIDINTQNNIITSRNSNHDNSNNNSNGSNNINSSSSNRLLATRPTPTGVPHIVLSDDTLHTTPPPPSVLKQPVARSPTTTSTLIQASVSSQVSTTTPTTAAASATNITSTTPTNSSPYSSIESDQFGVMGATASEVQSGSTSAIPALARRSNPPTGKSHGILEDSVFVMIPSSSSPPPTTFSTVTVNNAVPAQHPLPSTSSSIASTTTTTAAPVPKNANTSTVVPVSTRSMHVNVGTGPLANPSTAATPSTSADYWRPLLLLIPSRLGVSKVNPAYVEHLKFSLSTASSIGIVGGKPNKSLYFFAFQDDYVFYLDPHFVHSTVRPVDNKGGIHDSYKVRFPQKLKFLDLDPSLALGFFIRTRSDFEAFCQAHHNFAVTVEDDPASEPIFTIQDTAPDYLN